MRLVLTIPPYGKHVDAQHIPLREVGIDVGGVADCDALVDHPSVGTARVRLERRGDDWVVIDREGRGACSVGGVPLRAREARIIRPPHALRLGDLELALSFDPLDSHDNATRDVALRAAAFVAEVAPIRPRVRVVEGPRIGETLDLTHARPYRVGRGKSCDLFLDADDASREHFEIACDGDRVVVRDLGSPRGTFLGRSRLVANRGAVWDARRMLRAADAVFSLEVEAEGGAERLLEPLGRVPQGEGAAPPMEAEASDGHPPAAPDPAAAAPDGVEAPRSSATAEPVRSPIAEVPHAVPPDQPAGLSRGTSLVIVLLAVALGAAGVAALLALFLS